jgi:hypothetical protein
MMADLPIWIQKENEQKAQAAREAEVAAPRRIDESNFIQVLGQGYWDQLALALQFNALALEKLEGEELHGSLSNSVSGLEHNLHVLVKRGSVKYAPEFAGLNLWYIPGNGSMRFYCGDQMQPNIELVVVGQEVLALFDDQRLNADQLGEKLVRQLTGQVRAKQHRAR